jgi:E3 ubiquitin-protein ligase RNF14
MHALDMTCAVCQTHFWYVPFDSLLIMQSILTFRSYLCGAWLNPDHPYAHYNDVKNKHCYQRLMDGAEGEENDIQFGGRRGAEQAADFWEQEAMRIQMQLDNEETI